MKVRPRSQEYNRTGYTSTKVTQSKKGEHCKPSLFGALLEQNSWTLWLAISGPKGKMFWSSSTACKLIVEVVKEVIITITTNPQKVCEIFKPNNHVIGR